MIATLVEDEVRNEILFKYIDEHIHDKFTYLEIGVFLGGNIIRVAERYKGKISLWAVDNFQFDNVSFESKQWANVDQNIGYLDQFINNTKEHSINILARESLLAAESIPDNSLDCIFIDGAHREYDYHVKELQTWLHKVKDGGLVAGHDWPVQDIRNAVEFIFPNKEIIVASSNGGYGVIK